MKMKKFFIVLFLIPLFLLSGCISAFAMDSWFETEPIDETEAQEIFSRMNVKVIEEPDSVKGFTCFDVNENGDFVLGYWTDEKNYILVFNEPANFLYGFSLHSNGSLGVQWDNENIIYYSVRGDFVASIDKAGNLTEMRNISNTTENNTSYNRLIFGNKRQVGNVTYKAEKSILFSSMYSKLIKIEKDGTETVLFDVSKQNLIGTVIIAVLIVSAFVSIITYFIITIKKSIKNTDEVNRTKHRGRF